LPGLDYSLNPYRGCLHGCVYCLHPSTAVITKDGFVKIGEVQTTVVSHRGRFCTANNHFKHYYSGKLVDLKPFYLDDLLLTPDHKVLAVRREDIACPIYPRVVCFPHRKQLILRKDKRINCRACTFKKKPKPEWIPAVDLTKKDYVVVPVVREVRDVPFILVSEVLSQHKRKHRKNRKLPLEKIEKIFELRSKGLSYRKIAKELKISYGSVRDYLCGRSKDLYYDISVLVENGFVRFKKGKTKIPNKIAIDGDFLRLVGYYLAEGCVSIFPNRPNSAYLAFTFREDEREYISDVANLLRKIFKIKPTVVLDARNKSVHILSKANILAFLFATLFGGKSEEMKVPAKFLFLPLEKQRELMKGILRGDGGFCSSPRQPTFVTISRNLLDSVRLILLRLNIICRMQKFTKGKKRKHMAFALTPAAQFRQHFADLWGTKTSFKSPRNLYADIYEDTDHKYAIFPIRSKKLVDYSGPVYNLSVEEDNSYVANSVAVSNCYSPAVLRETRPWGQFVDVKINAVQVLEEELRKKPRGTVGIATVTDAYQPIEVEYKLTRRCLEILLKNDWPISIQTKSSLVLRDVDLIKQFSERDVGFTLTCSDDSLRQIFEPNSSSVNERLTALERLNAEGISTWVFIGPILPLVSERKLERLINRIWRAGVRHVMFDRLNLKPGIWPRIQATINKNLPDLSAEFEANAHSSDYFQKIENRIQQLCRAKGIHCEPAFKRFPSRLEK
jgi:DNA repair photolyase/transcriptional regulator with XRE-family HTH domain